MTELKSYLPEITLKYKKGNMKRFKITHSKDIFEAACELLNKDTVEIQEEFLVFFMNTINNTIGWIRLSSGGIQGTVADTRLIFSSALKCGATRIICVHNHPSGNVKPSTADSNMAKKFKEAGRLLDIELVDSIIISGELNEYYSLMDEGEL